LSIADIFSLYLPIAEIRVNILILIAVGVGIGFLSGMFGIGGGIILIPALLFIGVPTALAVSTVTNVMTASSFSGYLVYAKRNRVDYKLGILLLIGGTFGSVLGVYLFDVLSDSGKLDLFISMAFIIMLSTISVVMSKEAFTILYFRYKGRAVSHSEHFLRGKKFLPFHIALPSCKHSMSVLSPIIIGMLGGALVAATGIGGSLIMIPAMIYILRVSDAFTVGTAQFQIIFTTIITTLLHAISANSMDVILSVICILGVVLGVQLGARMGLHCHPENFRVLLAILIISLCIRVVINLYSVPVSIYEVESYQ
jgi:uncharacterized protein